MPPSSNDGISTGRIRDISSKDDDTGRAPSVSSTKHVSSKPASSSSTEHVLSKDGDAGRATASSSTRHISKNGHDISSKAGAALSADGAHDISADGRRRPSGGIAGSGCRRFVRGNYQLLGATCLWLAFKFEVGLSALIATCVRSFCSPCLDRKGKCMTLVRRPLPISRAAALSHRTSSHLNPPSAPYVAHPFIIRSRVDIAFSDVGLGLGVFVSDAISMAASVSFSLHSRGMAKMIPCARMRLNLSRCR